MKIEYSVVDGQRVMIGLSAGETAEFERLDSEIPMHAKPVWPDTMNSPTEQRWRVLYTKHDSARHAPDRLFGGRASIHVREEKPWSILYALPVLGRHDGKRP